MPINPAIALGVKGIELQDPLAQYGRVAAIQQAQQQNALANMQMQEYERARQEEQGIRNRLAAGAKLEDPETFNFLLGSKTGRDILKQQADFQKAQTEEAARRAKLMQDTEAMYRNMAGQISNKTDAATFLQRMINDPALKGSPIAMLPLEQQIQRIPDDPQGLDNWVKQFALGTTKWITENKPTITSQNLGGTVRLVQTPGLGGATTVVPGSTANVTMSPYESARIGQENQRLAQEATGVVYQEDANGNIVALPSKLKKGEVPTARVAVAPGGGFQPLTAKPSEAVGKEQMSINQQKSIVQGAIDAVKATPDAFGWVTGNMPESVRSRMASSEENQNRSFVFNVVSGVIKERAGTAQSAAEKATLERFLPVEGDNATVIEDKMKGFQKYLEAREAGTTKKRAAPEKPTPVRITGDDDYNKLPSGALFIGPDGQQRRKP